MEPGQGNSWQISGPALSGNNCGSLGISCIQCLCNGSDTCLFRVFPYGGRWGPCDPHGDLSFPNLKYFLFWYLLHLSYINELVREHILYETEGKLNNKKNSFDIFIPCSLLILSQLSHVNHIIVITIFMFKILTVLGIILFIIIMDILLSSASGIVH